MNQSTINKLLQLNHELYERQAQSFSDTRKEIWEKSVLDFIKMIRPKSNILDLGCGNARLLPQIILSQIPQMRKGSSVNYLGVDTSKTLIKENRKEYPNAKFTVGNGLNLKFNDKFNYVISLAVLHHIPSHELQLKFLENVHRALRSKGKVLLSVWNRYQDQYQKYINNPKPFKDMAKNDTIVPWRKSGYFRYIHVFIPKDLKKLAQKAGFKNIQCFHANKYGKTDRNNGLNIYLQGVK